MDRLYRRGNKSHDYKMDMWKWRKYGNRVDEPMMPLMRLQGMRWLCVNAGGTEAKIFWRMMQLRPPQHKGLVLYRTPSKSFGSSGNSDILSSCLAFGDERW